jgi:hypothetical protein
MRREATAAREEKQNAFAAINRRYAPPPDIRIQQAWRMRLMGFEPNVVLVVHEEEEEIVDEQSDAELQPVPRRKIQRLVIDQETFNRTLFNGLGEPTEQRVRLCALLAGRLVEVERNHPLTAEEKVRLQLAGRGDIKRFFDRVEEKRSEFERARLKSNEDNTRECLKLLGELEPLRRERLAGPFGETSIFSKTLNRIVVEQRAAKRRPR